MAYSKKKIVFPFQELLKLDEYELLLKNSNIVSYAKKDIIIRQKTRTSHVMFIISGLVKIYKTAPNHKRFLLKLSAKKEYFGLMSVFGSAIHEYSVAALNDTEICFIDIDTFKYIIKKNGNFALQIIKELSINGLFIFQKLISNSHKQLPGKIASVLLYLSEEIYKSQKFKLLLTRSDLADMVGTTKESLIRILMEFKHDKIIEIDGSNIEIKSLDIIKVLSDVG